MPRYTASSFFVGASLALALATVSLRAQTPALRWAFDQSKGAPASSIWLSGGTLKIEAPGAGFAVFQPVGGVGPSSPGVLNCAANTYGRPNDAARAIAVGSPLVADAELAQFVVTMWIKPTAPVRDMTYARLINISAEDDDKGSRGLLIALHESGLEVGVNGSVYVLPLPADSIPQSSWTFVALVYDGLAPNPYHSQAMITAVKSDRNCAVFLGGIETPVKMVGNAGFNTGAPGYGTPAGPIDLNGLQVAIGAGNSLRHLVFCGMIDDVRIYSGLLRAAEIDNIRAGGTQ